MTGRGHTMIKTCTYCGAALMPRHFDAVQLHASGYRYCTVRGGIPGTVATAGTVTL